MQADRAPTRKAVVSEMVTGLRSELAGHRNEVADLAAELSRIRQKQPKVRRNA